MPSLKNINLKERYKQILTEKNSFVMTRFTGVTVVELSDLRKELHKESLRYTIIKNNIFSLALKECEFAKSFPHEKLVGPIAVVFSDENLPIAAKQVHEFSKSCELLEIISAFFEFNFYDENRVKELINLPTREEALVKMAYLFNAPATQIASSLQQIMSSLARAIKVVGEKSAN